MSIPQISASVLCPPDLPVTILAPDFEHGGVTGQELEIIARITTHGAPEKIFEIGTFNGRTTLNLAANAPESAKVFTLDLPPSSQPDACSLRPDPNDAKYMAIRTFGSHFSETEYSSKIVRLFGDSAVFDFSPWNGQMDLVFVDGAHSYDYATSDSMRAIELTRGRKSVILWHDYRTKWDGVTAALDTLFASGGEWTGLQNIAGTSLVILQRRGD